jgi:hypothetical protein
MWSRGTKRPFGNRPQGPNQKSKCCHEDQAEYSFFRKCYSFQQEIDLLTRNSCRAIRPAPRERHDLLLVLSGDPFTMEMVVALYAASVKEKNMSMMLFILHPMEGLVLCPHKRHLTGAWFDLQWVVGPESKCPEKLMTSTKRYMPRGLRNISHTKGHTWRTQSAQSICVPLEEGSNCKSSAECSRSTRPVA